MEGTAGGNCLPSVWETAQQQAGAAQRGTVQVAGGWRAFVRVPQGVKNHEPGEKMH